MHVGAFLPAFGKNIKYLRSLCRMSQATLAELVGISPYYIRKIENANGMIGIDYKVFSRLCAVFGVEENSMFGCDLQEQGFALFTYTDIFRAPVEEYIYYEQK